MSEGRGRRAVWRRIARTAALLVAAPVWLHAQNTECEPGEREVRSLEFRGNSVFKASDLALRVATTSSDLMRRNFRVLGEKRCLDSDDLRLDVGRLRIFYRRHGYYDTKVDTSVTPAKDGYGGVKVAFIVNEGEPVRVDTLRISGLDSAVSQIVDTADLGLFRGMVFDAVQIQSAVDSMKSRLRNNGYPRGDVAANFNVFDEKGRRALVTLGVIPGARARIGNINVVDEPRAGAGRGLTDATILRLLGLREGDIYRERDLIEAQRALYQSDLFQHVDVTLAGATMAQRGDSTVGINVVVGEGFFRQLDTEAGWALLDCFKARVQFSDKNFVKNARRIELTGQVSKVGYGEPTRVAGGSLCAPKIRADTFSAQLNYFAGATMRFPALLGLRSSPSLSVYSERRSEYQAYLRTTLVGGEASLTREVAAGIPLRLAYSLEYGRTEAQPALLCALFARCDSRSREQLTDRVQPLAVASGHLERLRTDNPINPHSGTALRLDLRAAAKEIGSDPDIQFAKGLLDASLYRPAGRNFTFAARLRLGAVLGRKLFFRDSVGFIPPEERLYAGGAASVRGFQQNELGDLIYIAENRFVEPPTPGVGDTVYLEVPGNSQPRRVVPVGGNSLIVANLELRMRSPLFPDLIQYTLFADGGDVWQRGSPTLAKEHKAAQLWLNGLKWTPGIGVRVFTPVGPFQANVGYNPFARPAGAIYYDQAPNPNTGFAPLYCVSPGNKVPTLLVGDQFVQLPGYQCPSTYRPAQSRTFLSRLTFTFSIGPDF